MYKLSGYIQPPEEIIDWMMEITTPYLETAWASVQIKKLKEDLVYLKKSMSSNLYEIEDISKSLKRGYIIKYPVLPDFKEKAREKITDEKRIEMEQLSSQLNETIINIKLKIDEKINKIEELSPLIKLKMGGIHQESILEKEVPYEMTDKYQREIYEKMDFLKNKKDGTILNLTIKYKALRGAYFSKKSNSVVIGLYQVIYSKTGNIRSLEIANFNLRFAISHELIHWLQTIKNKSAEYGLPPKGIRDPEYTLEKYYDSSPQKQYETHSLMDTEFFSDLHSEMLRLKRLIEKGQTASVNILTEFINNNHTFQTWKNNNPEKYKRGIKELYRFWQDLYNNQKTGEQS